MARPEAYSEFSRASDIELFAKIVNGSRLLASFTGISFLDVYWVLDTLGSLSNFDVTGFQDSSLQINFFKRLTILKKKNFKGNLFASEGAA